MFVIVVLFLEIISRRVSTRLLSSSCLEGNGAKFTVTFRFDHGVHLPAIGALHMAPACPPWSPQDSIKPQQLCAAPHPSWSFHTKLWLEERSGLPSVQRTDGLWCFLWVGYNSISRIHLCRRNTKYDRRKQWENSIICIPSKVKNHYEVREGWKRTALILKILKSKRANLFLTFFWNTLFNTCAEYVEGKGL